MKLRVRLFSVYRDAVGSPELEVEIEVGVPLRTIVDVLAERFPHLREVFAEVQPLILVRGEVADPNEAIDGSLDEVALAPPASGGASVKTSLFRDDVSLDRVFEEVASSGVGAIAFFVGIVKSAVDGHRVTELVYEAYEPYATKILDKIAREEMARHRLNAVQIHHRVGPALPGQKTIVIAVSAIGRKEALEAVRDILERVKREAPIYKLEKREDGEYWVVGDGRRIPRARNG